MLATVRGVIINSKKNTIYDPHISPGSLIAPDELDKNTCTLLLDLFAETIDTQSASTSMESAIHAIATNAPLESSDVCPWSALWLAHANRPHGIYDLDGIEYLLWQSILADPKQSSKRICSSGPCERVTPRTYTCAPLRALTTRAIQGCFVPESLEPLRANLIKVLELDAGREPIIEKTFRSPYCGGPTMAAIMSGTTTMLFPDAATGKQPPKTCVKTPKGAKKLLRKWGDVRQRTVAATREILTKQAEPVLLDNEDPIHAELIQNIQQTAIGAGNKEVDFDTLMDTTALAKAFSRASKSAKAKQQRHARSAEYGDPAYGTDEFTLMRPEAEEEGVAVCPPDGNVALSDVMKTLWGIADVHEFHTVWADLELSDAHATLSIYEHGYPCGCGAELITSILDNCRRHLAEHEVAQFMRGQHPSTDSRTLRNIVETLSLDMALGTVPAVLGQSLEFVRLLRADQLLFYGSLPRAIVRAITSVSKPITAPGLAIFSDASAASPPFASAHSDVQDPTELRSWIIREWCHRVQQVQSSIIENNCNTGRQEWTFASVTSFFSTGDIVRATAEEGLHSRAADIAALAVAAGHLDKVGSGTTDPMIAVFSPPDAWACDVALSCSVAAAVLGVRPIAVGIPVIVSSRKTVVVLPYRPKTICNKGTVHPLDGLVSGLMIAALGGGSQIMGAPPVMLSCDMFYPFAFVVLYSSGAIYQEEQLADEARKIAVEGSASLPIEYGNSRSVCWRLLQRAGIAHISSICAAGCMNLPTPLYTQPTKDVPAYSRDSGALSEEAIHFWQGWRHLTSGWHTYAAIQAMGLVLPALIMSCTRQGNLEPELIARGIVCAARPMRLWLLEQKTADALSGNIHKLLPVFQPLSTGFVTVGADLDMVERTKLNKTILQAMATKKSLLTLINKVVDPPLGEDIPLLDALVLGSYKDDRLFAGSTQYCPIVAESCGTGDGVPFNITIEQPTDYPPYDEIKDAAAVPVLSALAKQFQESPPSAHEADRVLRFLAGAEAARSLGNGGMVATMEGIMKEIEHWGWAPLAIRTCDGTYVGADKLSIPIIDNPMTLAHSGIHYCRSCHARIKSYRSNKYYLPGSMCLLPKNSRLLAELIHRRHGTIFLPHAWPSGKDAKEEYSALLIRDLSSHEREQDISARMAEIASRTETAANADDEEIDDYLVNKFDRILRSEQQKPPFN